MQSDKIKLGVLYSEFDKLGNKEVEQDLRAMGVAAYKSLSSQGHGPILLDIDDIGFRGVIDYDILFNVCERFKGEEKEAQVATALELMGVHITGSPGESIAICNNKLKVKQIAKENGILTPRFTALHSLDDPIPEDLTYPVVVKPCAMHNSIGIFENSLAYSESQLRKKAEKIINLYSQAAIVEEYIPGKDVEISLLGNGHKTTSLAMEVHYPNNKDEDDPLLFSYESKWFKNSPKYGDYRPLQDISVYKQKEIIKTARRCYQLFGLRDYGRIDFRLTEKGKFYLIEVTANPGLSEESSTIRAAQSLGIEQSTMIYEIYRIAASRCNLLKGKKILA